uniref:K Homology domain-containing protein n=1 Tax=Chromera velia CCMP2878 TaxID=1169474 RepID=A0A0G4F4B4_9ALVE|eukprot:Cvel_2697.t1-p1 / transcript=Cvel_2697.t1 / gene=Cvel_2697 / organism=Chromera_velia_CCMP2878 / gene_product=hypothetical protein / transcript_product=hypothetical protein / location=Cvel_scaffold108:14502-26713(+) / protein_length=648 / sequence_SO=supercontig / SO=protein_coding / is_pseudo=false
MGSEVDRLMCAIALLVWSEAEVHFVVDLCRTQNLTCKTGGFEALPHAFVLVLEGSRGNILHVLGSCGGKDIPLDFLVPEIVAELLRVSNHASMVEYLTRASLLFSGHALRDSRVVGSRVTLSVRGDRNAKMAACQSLVSLLPPTPPETTSLADGSKPRSHTSTTAASPTDLHPPHRNSGSLHPMHPHGATDNSRRDSEERSSFFPSTWQHPQHTQAQPDPQTLPYPQYPSAAVPDGFSRGAEREILHGGTGQSSRLPHTGAYSVGGRKAFFTSGGERALHTDNALQNSGGTRGAGDIGGEREGTVRETVFVPAYRTPRLVGNKGGCLRDLNSLSGATFFCGSDTDEHGYKPVFVSGGPEEVELGARILRNKLATWNALETNGPVSKQIAIPDPIVSMLIGAGGRRITELQLLSGAIISVSAPETRFERDVPPAPPHPQAVGDGPPPAGFPPDVCTTTVFPLHSPDGAITPPTSLPPQLPEAGATAASASALTAEMAGSGNTIRITFRLLSLVGTEEATVEAMRLVEDRVARDILLDSVQVPSLDSAETSLECGDSLAEGTLRTRRTTGNSVETSGRRDGGRAEADIREIAEGLELHSQPSKHGHLWASHSGEGESDAETVVPEEEEEVEGNRQVGEFERSTEVSRRMR